MTNARAYAFASLGASSGISKLHERNFRSSLRCRVVTVHVDDTSHFAATLLSIYLSIPWYMPGSIAVLEDRYSEVVVNDMSLVLKWQLFSLM